MIEELVNYCKSEAPREACGVIGNKKGERVWFPVKNIADSEHNFKFDGDEFIRIQLQCKVDTIFHSHPGGDIIPSQTDYEACNLLGLDYMILNLEGDSYTIQPLSGRQYEWGQADCFTFANDYYMTKKGWFFERKDFTERWWESTDRDYFNEYFEEYGFREVTDGSISVLDLILFNVHSKVPNHCGVYIGQSQFAHHARHRLSVQEDLYPRWGIHKSKVLRHESLFNG